MEQQFEFGRPLGQRLVIEADKAAETTAKGLYIPVKGQVRPQIGTVLSAGKDCVEVAAGDRVLYGKHAGIEMEIGAQTFYIMLEREIFAVLDQEALDRALAGLIEAAKADETTLVLTTDQPSYKVGDVIKIELPEVIGNILFIGEQAGAKQFVYNKKEFIHGLKGVFAEIKVTEEMAPGFQLKFTLSQTAGDTTYDKPLVKQGSLTIAITD